MWNFPLARGSKGYGNNQIGSQSGKLIHELVEQYYKQVKKNQILTLLMVKQILLNNK